MTVDTITEIEKLEERRRKAMVGRDIQVLEDLLSDELIYVHNNAAAEGKQQYLEQIRAGVYNYREVVQPEILVRLIAGVALVTGRTVLKVTLPDGSPKTVDGTTVTIWAPVDGKWRLEYYQGTPRSPIF
jgi:ketosteroid isomerase-like protein